MNLYNYIIINSDKMDSRTLNSQLKEHELNCLSRWLKAKFEDKRTISEIKDLIKEELCLGN